MLPLFVLQSLPRLFSTPGPQGVGVYKGKLKQDTVCSVIRGLGGTALQEVW